jgi:glycosyltransferase involved in cell wall biosynthesis
VQSGNRTHFGKSHLAEESVREGAGINVTDLLRLISQEFIASSFHPWQVVPTIGVDCCVTIIIDQTNGASAQSRINETDVGIPVRFLSLDPWYRPLERVFLKRLSRQTRWSLYAEERLNTMAFMAALKKALVDDKIDLLYIQEYWSGRFDHIVHRVGVPVSGADHGGVARGVLKLFKPQAFGKAAVCYGQTEAECQLIEQYGGKAKLQHNGCDVFEFFPDPKVQRNKTVLTVARLTNRQKRTSDLIRAVKYLPEEWTLDIVGTGPDRSMLERLASDLQVSTRIRFHGFVGRDEIRSFFQQCGVYAMPSENEAVAIAALEAMASGAAVVLTRIPAFEQLIDDGINGHLVPIADVKALADGILKAWEHRTATGRAASETVQKHYNSPVLYRQLADSLRSSAREADEQAR